MRGDDYSWPVRSFFSLFGWPSSSPSHQPRSPPANNDTHIPSTSQYEPHRSMSPAEIQISGPTPVHATPPPSSSYVFIPSSKSPPTSSAFRRPVLGPATLATLLLEPSTSERSRQSSPSSPRYKEKPNPILDRLMKPYGVESSPQRSSIKPPFCQSPCARGVYHPRVERVTQFRSSIPQCREEHHPTLDQSMKASDVESVHQHSSAEPPHYQLPYVRHPSFQLPRVEQVPPPGTLLEPASSNPDPPRLQPRGSNMFYHAHDFVIKNSVFVDNSSDNFMASFLKETILGAEFDSSDPNMPLRCHPGTRLEIIKRCQDFILDRESRPKLQWVVGAAGVGKSAIMQSVARDEFQILSDIIVGATVFFSINGRDDGTKAIMTISYQLAVKLNPYRLFVQREVTHDPSLLRKSLPTQFEKFIIEPFIRQRISDCPSCLLIIIDGLDECANHLTQQELLGLVSDFCITYPSSPLVWMIASRPEPHITSFFSQPKVALAYEKEEILVDSDDAHEDVKRYLWDKFNEVQMASITLRQSPRWPSADDFSKVAEASGGLFAYASTVVRYINDPSYGDPVSQLDDVLNIIDAGTKSNVSDENHPMAQLDILYAHIMSKIPAKVMANTRKILLLYVGRPMSTYGSLHFKCNMLGMTEHTAYGATHHIRAVAIVPEPNDAASKDLEFYHKSFPDYLRDFRRSGFSPDIDSEAQQLMNQCVFRLFKEAPDGVYTNGANSLSLGITGGVLKNRPGTVDNISVSWPDVGEYYNGQLRFDMFRNAIWQLMDGFRGKEEAFRSLLCMRVLTTCFARLDYKFPFDVLSDSVFDESRHCELLNHGILKLVPLETLDYNNIPIDNPIRLRFKSPTVGLSNPWNTSCEHEREGSWEGHSQDWSTVFMRGFKYSRSCGYCFERFVKQCHTQAPGRLVAVCNLTPVNTIVELRFTDPDDDVSEWIYHFSIERGDEEEVR